MKKGLFVALVVSVVLIASPAYAYWPATHQQIAQEELLPYINGGAIAPDWCLAYDMAIGDEEIASHHNDFHSEDYVRLLRLLAKGKERVFAEAYAIHVEADKLPDGVDEFRGESYIILCPELMIRAYKYAFSKSEWQPTVDEIEALYLANIAYQSTLPEAQLRNFESVDELKAMVAEYRHQTEFAVVLEQDCYRRAYDMEQWFYSLGKNMDVRSESGRVYNRVFGQLRVPTSGQIDRHYFCWCLVNGYEFWVDPLTGEIERTSYWAVGETY